jgi:hypothetical protein
MHSVLNFRFDMIVVFTINYFLVGDNVSVDSEMFLITNFINFKIKSTQSFKNTHINMMCVYTHTSMLKKRRTWVQNAQG